jgi:hypothetical protein
LDNKAKLNIIKLVHTAIWCIFVIAILYVLYAGVFDKVNMLVWICVGLVVFEAIILIVFKWKCPFTILGQKYTTNHEVGFDIFLPIWLAKNNKTIFSILFTAGLVLCLWRVFT